MKLAPAIVASLCAACASGSVDSSPSAPRGSADATSPIDSTPPADALTLDLGPADAAALAVDGGATDSAAPEDMRAPADRALAPDADTPDAEPPRPDAAPPPDAQPPEPEPGPVDMAVPIALPERLIINEIDYDQAGNDLADFVEILNPAATPAPLDAVVVEFINGDPLEIYRVVPLDGVLASGGRLVLGQQAVLDALPGGVRGILIADGIQNGAPDAIRLMTPEGPLDGVAYEGDLPGFGEGAGPITADQGLDAGGSLARCPDGADTDDNATDVRLVPEPTPGVANRCP